MRLLFFLGLLAVASHGAVDTTGKNLSQILEMIKDIEGDLKRTVASDYFNAVKDQKDLQDAAVGELKKGVNAMKEKMQETLQKLQDARDEAEAKVEEQRQKMVDDFKAKIEERKQAKAAEKEAARQKFEQLKADVKAKIEAKKAAQEAKKQELAGYIQEVQEAIKENRAAREEEKAARTAEQKQKRDDFLQNYAAQSDTLRQEAAALKAKYDELTNKQSELKDSLKEAFGEGMRTKFGESVEDYLQDKLEKEVFNRGVYNILHPKDVTKMPMPTILPSARASLIDTLTGKSGWETVTWVLLALCILLAVALVALIVYQVVQQNKKNGNYEKLDGNNEAGAPGDEKAGLLPKKSGAAAAPYGGADETQPQQPKQSTSAEPKKSTAAATPTAPAEEGEEKQQF